MFNEKQFILKCREFRLNFDLTEDDIELLLEGEKIKYKGLELGSRTLTLRLAEAYPLIYGIEYCDFKKAQTTFPAFEELPILTKNLISKNSGNSKNNIGNKGSKNKPSHIIIALQTYSVDDTFTNSEIISKLPPPLDSEKTIDWNKGLLKGLVKNTGESRTPEENNSSKRGEDIFKVVKTVDSELLERALKNLKK